MSALWRRLVCVLLHGDCRIEQPFGGRTLHGHCRECGRTWIDRSWQ